jgi:hypothetical protein
VLGKAPLAPTVDLATIASVAVANGNISVPVGDAYVKPIRNNLGKHIREGCHERSQAFHLQHLFPGCVGGRSRVDVLDANISRQYTQQPRNYHISRYI